MSALPTLLTAFRNAAVSKREKGTYFEELMVTYLRNEASYQDLYSDVWAYTDWAKLQGLDGRDPGIDLVAKTQSTDEQYAIQCKFYAKDYRVQKTKYGAKKGLTTLHYNSKITVTGIPLEAYDYIVNGKPAQDWVVERQCVSTHKDNGIVNDANEWAIDTMNNPKYPLELFLRVITVSLETMKIVRSLPPLVLLMKEHA